MLTVFNKGIALSVFLFCLCLSAQAQVQASRKYRVVAYKSGNPQVFSVSNEIEIIPTMAFYVPTAFTPNGDGLNDTFGVSGEAVKELTIQVFNRWGQLIYETRDLNGRWDGRFQGEPVPQGSYAYRIQAYGVKGNQLLKEGQISVIL